MVAAIGGAGLFFSGFMLGRLNGQTPGTSDANQELFRPFWDAYNDVSNNYVGEVAPHVLVEGAIKGIFNALSDPFSQYLTEEEYRASLGGISGNSRVSASRCPQSKKDKPCETISETCLLTVTRVIRGSPATAAGFLEGDVLLAVDGTRRRARRCRKSLPTCAGRRDRPSSCRSHVTAPPKEISVVRDVIQREDVRSEVLADGKVGYVKIEGFSSASAQDLRDQLRALIEDDGVDALILDLRDDPGATSTLRTRSQASSSPLRRSTGSRRPGHGRRCRTQVVFDRGGFIYHGRIAAVAAAAR